MMREWERGTSRLKTVIWLLIIASALYVAAKIVPIYFANFQLQDKMRDEALYAQANHRTAQQVHEAIYRAAQSLDLPVQPEDINVEMNPQGTRISADYTAIVDLTVYKLRLHLTAAAGGKEP